MGTEAVGMGWDGYSVHRDGRGWGSVSVPMQTSSNYIRGRIIINVTADFSLGVIHY